jgi:response regulator RpfG family c-di-GMP phosphodiesterase
MVASECRAKILFVDDELSILKAFRLNLGRLFDVYTAESGIVGLELIEEEGPFEVIVSDFAMPRMNGAEFLQKVREQDKEVVTMLLTGQANFDDVCDVVRKGEIFRLISKPCPPEKLSQDLEHAINQHRLVRTEKELLEKTLNGTITAFSSLLSSSSPKIFNRANRVERLARDTAKKMRLPGGWRLGIAAKFSYLGYLTIPESVQDQVFRGDSVTDEYQERIDKIPDFVSGLLKDIPNLESVSRIIKFTGESYDPLEESEKEEQDLASLIRLCRMYVSLEENGFTKSEIFKILHSKSDSYVAGSVDALATI